MFRFLPMVVFSGLATNVLFGQEKLTKAELDAKTSTVKSASQGYIDCHLHLFPEAPYKEWPTAWPQPEKTILFGLRKADVVRGRSVPNPRENLELTLQHMDRNGIEIGVLSGDNELVLKACAQYPDRLLASFLFTNVWSLRDNTYFEAFRRQAREGEWRGLGEISVAYFGMPIDSDQLDRWLKVAAEEGMPAFFHCGASGPQPWSTFDLDSANPRRLEKWVKRYPNLNVVIGHAGWPHVEDTHYMLYSYPNVHVEVGAIVWNFARPELFERILAELIAVGTTDRIIFGSDQMDKPERVTFAMRNMKNAMEKLSLTSEQQMAILRDNARRLYKVGDRPSPQGTGAIRKISVHEHAYHIEEWNKLFPPEQFEPMYGRQPRSDKEYLELTLQHMDKNNIRWAVISGHDDLVAEWAKKYPDRFIPSYFPFFHTVSFDTMDHEQLAKKFGESVDQGGFRALGEMALAYLGVFINDRRLWPYYRVAEEKGVPVLIHAGNSLVDEGDDERFPNAIDMTVSAAPRLVEDVVKEFPRLKVIVGHMGFRQYEETITLMKRHANVYTEGSYYNWDWARDEYHAALRRFKEEGLLERVLFGADQCGWPGGISVAVTNTDNSGLTTDELKAIYWDNAAKLFAITKGNSQSLAK